MSKLNDWKDKLLDLSKSNRMLNFKDSRSSSVQILLPEFEAVFSKILAGNTFEFYNIDATLPKETFYSKEVAIAKFEKQLKQKQLLGFVNEFYLNKTLRSLEKMSKDTIVEKGINALYMAFGFISWTDGNTSASYNAPLILIPIRLDRASKLDPYTLSVLDDDVTVNPTLLYFLKENYNLTIPTFDDENPTGFFTSFNQCIEKLGWEFKSEVKIGMFSFQKMNMYLDIKNNEDIILQNANVQNLLDVNSKNNSGQNSSTLDMSKLVINNVVDADSSQIEAIKLAKAGKSFVLQGPPGTGKSQTITNIVAECLMDGKKILFVSEKLAALSVVYNKLKQVELDDFCLELHSNKSNKCEVIAELNRVLSKSKTTVSNRAIEELARLEEAKSQLDKYDASLHKVYPCIEKSPFQIYGQYLKNEKFDEIDFTIKDIQTKGEKYNEEVAEWFVSYLEYTKTIGDDFRANEWYGYSSIDNSYENTRELQKNVEVLLDGIEQLSQISSYAQDTIGISVDRLSKIDLLKNLYFHLDGFKMLCTDIFEKSTLKKATSIFNNASDLSQKIINAEVEVNKIFNKDVYTVNAKDMLTRYLVNYKGAFRGLKKEYKNDVASLKVYAKNPKEKLKYKSVIKLLKLIISVKEYKQKIDAEAGFIKKYIGDEYKCEFTSWATYTQFLGVFELISRGVDLQSLSKLSIEQLKSESKSALGFANRIEKIKKDIKESLEFLSVAFDKKIFDFAETEFDIVQEKLEKLHSSIDNINNWQGFLKHLTKAIKLDIYDYLIKAIDGGIDKENLFGAFEKQFFKRWIFYIYTQDNLLAEFSRIKHDRFAEIFVEKDKLQFDIAKAQINAKLSKLRPNKEVLASGSATSILLREGEKKRKQMPVRYLLNKIPDLVQILKPCFLMSPLSVSTYLDPTTLSFDVVVFDEASQIFPEDAIGSIYRAKQVIVVGDSKQMPPSNFFNAIATDEGDEDNFDESIKDYESILDICSTCYMQNRLKWHYRSRNEDLIAFSNKNFYNSELVTFPSPTIKQTGSGVDFSFVEGGTFNRKTKTNSKEAKAVAEEVFNCLKLHPERSVGVVAFSKSQQEEIDNEINRMREENASLDAYFTDSAKEPFFVKNLETVQGDERDTIIFSIAYAKDEAGKFLHNFGPLNRVGGERRLNVAVTRAKINVKVISSIRSYDINLNKTKAEGARLLKEYLEYAETGNITLDHKTEDNIFTEKDNSFEDEIYNFLVDNGYTVSKQVGFSDYKIDLAVKQPDANNYAIAIECDGATYHACRSTRDRDRLRREVLERLGWRCYRIWSTDWFKNGNFEKQRLIDAVESALSLQTGGAPKKVATAHSSSFKEKAKAESIDNMFEKYVQTKAIRISEIIKAEAPISKEWLLKRIVWRYNSEKITQSIRNNFDYDLTTIKGIEVKKGFIYLKEHGPYRLRLPNGDTPRDIKYIAPEELCAGFKVIVQQNISIPKGALFLATAKLLGFTRIGKEGEASLENALAYAMEYDLFKYDGENIELN